MRKQPEIEVLEFPVPRASTPETSSSTERNHSNGQINPGHKEGNGSSTNVRQPVTPKEKEITRVVFISIFFK